MKKMLIATSNAHKVKEFEEMLAPLGYQVISLLDIDEKVEIVEDGKSFEENALIKARALHSALNCAVMSDDSGLAVDALDGAPGVYSARFMGEDTDYKIKNQAIIDAVAGKTRGAQFVCVIAYVDEAGKEHTFRGEVVGSIHTEIVGEHGFGYDPIFYYEPYHTTLANVSEDEKNAVSHRSRALTQLVSFLKEEEK